MNSPTLVYPRDGAAIAAILAAAVSIFYYGIAIILCEVSAGFREMMNWYPPAGPLSGKSGSAVIIWLVLWAIFHQKWKNREILFGPKWRLALVLITLGLILSFPPVFEAFTAH